MPRPKTSTRHSRMPTDVLLHSLAQGENRGLLTTATELGSHMRLVGPISWRLLKSIGSLAQGMHRDSHACEL